MSRALVLLALYAAPCMCAPDTAAAQAVDTTLWVANGAVLAMAKAGNTLYIGGQFTQVSPPTGGGVPIGVGSGNPVSAFPKVAGSVYAIASDGGSGWYIGGSFTAVGGLPRQNLAFVRNDYSVSPWNPGANNPVLALAFGGSVIYAGGMFTSVAGQTRNYAAAVDTGTAAATSWDPNANAIVRALAYNGSIIYAGGNFTTMGGFTRNGIAALNAVGGTPTNWNPNANGEVHALAVSGVTVYAGGTFTNIGGGGRNRIAALDATINTSNVKAWNPNADGVVDALVVNGTIVYAAGNFNNIGGAGRAKIAALGANINTNNATSWNPTANSEVLALALNGSTLYAGGSFTNIGGQNRNRVAAIDVSTGNATSWNPNANGTVQAILPLAAAVYVGGPFTGLGGVVRSGLAALNLTTGAATGWNPSPDSTVFALATNGATVYAGGTFLTIGGQSRNRIAELDTSGAATSWNPNSDHMVRGLLASGTTLYVAGDFHSIGGQPRDGLAALNAGTGLASSWHPAPNNIVVALALSDTLLYAGGDFTTIGGQSRSYIAVLSTKSGLATSWDPSANNRVGALAVSGSLVYAGGAFTTIGGQSRNTLAALNRSNNSATAWDPTPSGSETYAIAPSGPIVYVGGTHYTIGGQIRSYLAAVDANTGLATAWNAGVDNAVYALIVSGTKLYAGGAFSYAGVQPAGGVVALNVAPGLSAIAPATGGNTGAVSVTLTGSGLPAGASVALTRPAHADIAGTGVTVAADGSSATATFNLAGADTGLWTVSVQTPDQQSASLSDAFRITAVSAPELRVSLVGYSIVGSNPAMLKNHRTAFDLVIENRGNADAAAVPLWLAGIPTDATLELDFAPGYPPHSGGEPDWSTVPQTIDFNGLRYLPLVLPRVAPGTASLRVYLTVPNPPHASIQLTAALTPPWEDGAVFRSCITGAGITNPTCVGSQLTSINAYLLANPQIAAFNAVAVWAKAAYACEPGAGTFAAAVAKATQVLDTLETTVVTGSAPPGCGDVRLPLWRDTRSIALASAVDPNDKIGTAGTLSGQQALPYTIRFENLSGASAAAQRAWVDDVLDYTKLDLGTVSLGPISFSNVTISPPPLGGGSVTTDLPARDLRVEVAAYLDPFTHRLTWYFNSTLISTGRTPPISQGFLLPNNAQHEGEGSVQFTVQPLATLPPTATVSNSASITLNDPPATNTQTWTNTLDNAAPSSHVKPFATAQDPGRYVVQWEPVGAQPDLRDYTIYAREDNGPYWAWRRNTVALSDTFAARAGHSYSFYSRARDAVSNVEPAPSSADAQYSSSVGVVADAAPELSLAGAWPNPARGVMQVLFSLPSAEPANLELFDVAGRRILRRAVGALGPGRHVLALDAEGGLRAGLYFLRLSQSGHTLHARVALMR